MADELSIFSNSEFGSVRVLEINGEPWFVGKDICLVFGDMNHNRSIGRVADEDKRVIPIVDSLGRMQNATVVNESGLYSLLFAMQPQKANKDGVSDAYPIETQERISKLKEFKHWVTSEVLPSIRKNGIYATEVTIDKIISDPDFGIQLLTELKEQKQKNKILQEQNATLALKNKVQEQQIAEMSPKVTYYDTVLSCKEAVAITVIAKDYGWSAKKLNEYLFEKGIQYKVSRVWVLKRNYADKGYTKTETGTKTKDDGSNIAFINTKWTQKGRLFIYELLKADGILPIIEQQQK